MPELEAQLVQKQDLINLAILNDSLYPRKTAVTAEIDDKIKAQLSASYIPSGSVDSIDDLPELTEENFRKMYNVNSAFTTTEDFVEGAGTEVAAGTNVAIVAGEEEGTFKYDAMAGMFDQTGIVKQEELTEELEKKVDKLEGMGLSSNDFTAEEKAKLAGMKLASSADVIAEIKAAIGVTDSGSEEEGEETGD